MNILLRRTGALAAAALAASALALPAGTANAKSPSATADTGASLRSGAAWLSSELSAGKWGSTSGGTFYPDMGAVIDAGYAAAAAGNRAAVKKAADTLAVPANADSYVGSGTEHYSGPTGKALAFQQLAGRSTTLGSHHLLTDLESMVTASGRIQDTSAYGDYANSIGQAFAAEALHRAGSTKATAATGFLLTQQCSAGWFRLYFTDVTPASTGPDDFPPHAQSDASCDSDPKATPDTDVTAYAVLNLLDQRSTPAVNAAITKALGWLEKTQKADGSFVGGVSTDTPNADSTGLAGWALGAAARGLFPGVPRAAAGNQARWTTRDSSTAWKAAAKAAGWIYRHQLHGGPDAGAIAYDDTALRAVTRKGIDDTVIGQWRTATAQALPSLAYLPGVGVSAKPAKSAHRGTVTLRVSVSGVKRFTGKITVKVGKKKLHAKVVRGTAKLTAAKVFHGRTHVRAVVSFKGSATVAPFSKRIVLEANHR